MRGDVLMAAVSGPSHRATTARRYEDRARSLDRASKPPAGTRVPSTMLPRNRLAGGLIDARSSSYRATDARRLRARARRGERRPRGAATGQREVDAGDDPVDRRREAARRRAAAEEPACRPEDAGDRLDRPLLQPLGPDWAARSRRGHAVQPRDGRRPVRSLLR